MLTIATEKKSSDIYFLCEGQKYRIAMRTSHGLTEYDNVNINNANQIINCLKYAAKMVVSEKRRPQMGRIMWQKYPIRLSTVGDVEGNESLVMRVIYDSESDDIHFLNGCEYSNVRSLCDRRGMIVFAGPTGSGKTTTIYKLASELSKEQVIMTIEDPVELNNQSFLQLQINEAAGLNYSELIKVGLRHRPDVFIVGEIRDNQTANAAIQAALSGHLVLTTVHAQSPAGVIQRLQNLGIEQQFIDQALTGVAYQRILETVDGAKQGLLISHSAKELKHLSYDWHEWQMYLKQGVANGEITDVEAERYEFG